MLARITTIALEVVERLITTFIVDAVSGKKSSITIHELQIHISNELNKYGQEISNINDIQDRTLVEIQDISRRLDLLRIILNRT